MGVTETILANKFSRSKALSLFLMLLFTFSTMSLPACSDNDNSTVSQRVVQAMVSFDDEGPVATAWVQDGDQNYVSDAILSINNRPFEVILLGDVESNEDSVPIYYLELYDLKGGDSLTLVAKRSDDTVIYAPPSAQIPMPIELVEPTSDQTIIPEEEIVIRWTGGEGAAFIAAFFADDIGEEQYLNVQKYEDVEPITVPAGIITEGGGIIGAAALSGDDPSFKPENIANMSGSSFLVYRDDAIPIQTAQIDSNASGCPSGQKKGNSGRCCPNNPTRKGISALCGVEFAAVVGAVVWSARWGMDAKSFPPCPVSVGPLGYCIEYSQNFSHTNWMKGCVCPHP